MDNISELSRNDRSSTDRKGYYRPSFDRLRFILMIFLFVFLFGLPTNAGIFLQNICGFVPLTFFLTSGYLVLRDDEDRSGRILRTIKRTAIAFVGMTVGYLIINFAYYKTAGVNMFDAFTDLRAWFNFLVMNVWQFDIGTSIWYVQALLYAYVIIFVLEKTGLLKYDWIIALVLILFTVITGELSGVIGMDIFGYTYIPGNFLTRALPYLLLGNFIHRKADFFFRFKKIHCVMGIILGIGLCVIEIVVLGTFEHQGYYGHLLGMPVIAICILIITAQDELGFSRLERRLIPTGWVNNLLYYLAQPVYIGIFSVILVNFGTNGVDLTNGLVGAMAFLVCYAITVIITAVRRSIHKKKYYKHHSHHRHHEHDGKSKNDAGQH